MKNDQISYIYVDWNFRLLEAALSYRYWEEDGWILAECPELQLVDQGETLSEAVNNLSNMITASLIDAILYGKLKPMLKKLGFKKRKVQIPNREFFKQSAKINGECSFLPIKTHFPISMETLVRK